MTSVSSHWIPEDDLLLKNSVEAGASLEALAKGAVKFSRRFTFRELRDRWYSLLYDPEVASQASVRMAELEASGTNTTSKSRLDNMKGGDKVHEKRKSIRRQYHAMRKRIKNEYFSSPNYGFFEERKLHNSNYQEHKFQDHVNDNHEAHGGDAVLDLGFEEKDFEILRQAFPESIGTVATATTTRIVNNPANAFHIDGRHKSVENNFLNGSTREEGGLYKFTQDVSLSRSKLIGSFDSNNEIKNGTCIEEAGPSATPSIEKLPKIDRSAGFGGKQHFHSPVSDGSASFHTLGYSSPSTRLPLWKSLEDVSAPAMPVDENNAESHQVSEETLALEDCDLIRETKGSPGYDGLHHESHVGSRPIGFNNLGGVHEGEYTDLPDSLLNFPNEDEILFMDTDVKDTMHDISNPLLLDSPTNVQEVNLCNADATPSLVASLNLAIPNIQCREEPKDSSVHGDQIYQEFDVPSTSVSQPDSLLLTEGEIICTLNREDPDIPCNDDIFLLIHPSTQFASSVGLQNATDSIDPLSSSSHDKDSEHGLVTVSKGKDPAPSLMLSHTIGSKALPEFVKPRPLVGCSFKRESPDGEYVAPPLGKPNNIRISSQTNNIRIPSQTNNIRIPSQTRPMHVALESRGNGMLEERASKLVLRGMGSPAMYNQMPLPPVTMINPASNSNSYIDDHNNNSDSDGDIPYFSDVEAMILEMDLVDAQESRITSEVARYQNESAKRMIMRLEQAARSSFQRAMSSHGALAIFYGRRLKHYIRKAEVTIGRSTDDTEVDIDLRKEGRANKISRRQAIIKLEKDGSFSLKNLGASSISVNGKEVAHGQLVALISSCLIEIRGMSFVFEINDKYVRRFLENQPI